MLAIAFRAWGVHEIDLIQFNVMHKLRVILRTCFKSTRATADVCTSSARACITSALRLFVLLFIYCWAQVTI